MATATATAAVTPEQARRLGLSYIRRASERNTKRLATNEITLDAWMTERRRIEQLKSQLIAR